jgi:hypothetical protein
MGLLQNQAVLEKISAYLAHTNFGNQSIGHNLTLGFLPPGLKKVVEDKRYTMTLRHRLFEKPKEFKKATFSEIIVNVILHLNQNITDLPEATLAIYTETGLIEDNRCTKELIGTVVSNSIAMNPTRHEGNTTTKMPYSNNLQNVFPEFSVKNTEFFLSQLDKYKQQIP